MIRRMAATLLSIATLAAPLAANAQAYSHRDHGGGGGYGERGGGYSGAPHGYPGGGGFGGRGFGPPANPYRGGPGARTGPGPGPGYAGARSGDGGFIGARMAEGGPRPRGLMRGAYLSPEARGPMIQDFQRYHLRRPPRGYYWYRTGDDFVLAGVSTGVVFEVIPADPY
jgi:Ni/Co efflux regulator RcnB